jgi:hypothetical protein
METIKSWVRRVINRPNSVVFILFVLIFVGQPAEAKKVYSAQTGNWETTSTWVGGVVPVAGDTVIIKTSHTVSITSNLYSNSTYMFLIIVGSLDLTNNGKLNLGPTANVIIETGGKILGDGNSDQISIGSGTSEYRGGFQGEIVGPSYVNDGHTPVDGEGTAGCGCYTPGTIPLPVKLLYFTAVLDNGMATISWATAAEKDFDHFELERSVNDLEFTQLATLPGAGYNTSDVIRYQSSDENPLIGINYYRLKAVDLDGSYEYFQATPLPLDEPRNVSVYPNPSNGHAMKLKANFEAPSYDRVVVYSLSGAEVYSISAREYNNEWVPSDHLQPGVYMVRYTGASFTKSIRLVVTQ